MAHFIAPMSFFQSDFQCIIPELGMTQFGNPSDPSIDGDAPNGGAGIPGGTLYFGVMCGTNVNIQFDGSIYATSGDEWTADIGVSVNGGAEVSVYNDSGNETDPVTISESVDFDITGDNAPGACGLVFAIRIDLSGESGSIDYAVTVT
jgi:hypothetical protein